MEYLGTYNLNLNLHLKKNNSHYNVINKLKTVLTLCKFSS